jgi:hypothetical protein
MTILTAEDHAREARQREEWERKRATMRAVTVRVARWEIRTDPPERGSFKIGDVEQAAAFFKKQQAALERGHGSSVEVDTVIDYVER